jgi:prevent-host-death family protein
LAGAGLEQSEPLTFDLYNPSFLPMDDNVQDGVIVASMTGDTIGGVASKRLNVAEARGNLADLLNEVAYRGQRMVLMRRGKDLAALVPMADLAALRSIETPAFGVLQDARYFTLTVSCGEGTDVADGGDQTANP